MIFFIFFINYYFDRDYKIPRENERIIYKTLVERDIDRQFSEENFPSKVYSDMFDATTFKNDVRII